MGLMFPIYFLTTVLSGGLTFISAHSLLELSDLDCNFINPQKACANLNSLVLPELLFVGIIVTLHAVCLNWIFLALNFPMLLWLIYSYRSPRGYVGLHTVTDLSDEAVMSSNVRKLIFKIIFNLIQFFTYIYLAIISLLTA